MRAAGGSVLQELIQTLKGVGLQTFEVGIHAQPFVVAGFDDNAA